jgi:hypothetical protein
MNSADLLAKPQPARAVVSSDGANAAGWLRIAILTLALPMFAQTFHYIKDLSFLWALSKAFPILSAPLALALLWRRLPRDALAWLLGLAWLVLVPSVTAIFAFEQSFFLGLTAQVKLLGMLHAASFLGLLLILRPSLAEISVAFGVWAAVMAFALIALWGLAPLSWYSTGYEFGDAPFLSIDHRGTRIRMPMVFILIGLFWAQRRLLERLSLRDIALVLGGLALAIFIVGTRAVIAATLATLALILISAAPRPMRIAGLALAAIGTIVFLLSPAAASLFDGSLAIGSDIRLTTARIAMEFLGNDPVRWMLGVGTLSPLDPAALARFFNHFFFLSDVSWLGVVFEYGLVGASIVLALIARAWWLGQEVQSRIRSPFLAALQDYLVFVLLISPLYSVMTLQPGEVAVIAAIFTYGTLILRESGMAAPSPSAA